MHHTLSVARVHNDPRFGIRATGVIVDRGRVLGHRTVDAATPNWWALPGGGPLLQEPTAEAVVRELHEELGVDAVAIRLLWVIEHFFGTHHGIDFVHLVEVPREWTYRDVDEFVSEGEEEYGRLLQRWLPLDEEGLAQLYPECLRTLLVEPLPETPGHVVHWQRGSVGS